MTDNNAQYMCMYKHTRNDLCSCCRGLHNITHVYGANCMHLSV